MFRLLVLISLLASNGAIAFTLNASFLTQLGYNNQSTHVNIYNYDITDIDTNAFKGYSNVVYLSFASCSLTKIDLEVLKDLVNLVAFEIQDSPFSQMTNSKRIIFKQLQNLNFYDCPLVSLDSNVINSLPNLTQLTIDNHNQLSPIKPNQLSVLKKLLYLTLSTNNQMSLTKAHFTGLNSLWKLDFKASNIQTMEVQTLLALPNVLYVDFSNNAFTSFDYLQIPNKLVGLYLGGNKLSFFRLSKTISVIKMLDLNGNQFRSFKSIDFTFLANLTFLDLSYNPHAYPSEIAGHMKPLVNLNYILLNNLSINLIDSNFFKQNTKLENIGLSYNKISVLPYNTFTHLKNLSVIYLYDNQISDLDNRTFVGLNKLTSIDLKSNKLTKIRARTFYNLSRLSFLDLSNNLISEIDSSALTGCKSLWNLYLNNNRLIKLSPRTFENLNIETLLLRYNQITELDNSTFAGVGYIVSLGLSYNNISRIGSGTFKNLTFTQRLDLSYNRLTKLDNGSFLGLNYLYNIDLSNNKISTIEAGAFNGLSKMIYIYLNNNNLTRLDNSTFAGCNRLSAIYLYNNTNLSKNNLQSLCPTASCKVYY